MTPYQVTDTPQSLGKRTPTPEHGMLSSMVKRCDFVKDLERRHQSKCHQISLAWKGGLTLKRKQWTKEAAIGGRATSQEMPIASKGGKGAESSREKLLGQV